MENNYPLTGFHFSVNWIDGNDENVNFSEVTGLSVQANVIEYRDGSNIDYTTVKMPGLRKYNNVILKRGSLSKDNGFFDWFNTIQNNVVQRRNITINLLDESHSPVIVWHLINAFPVKYDGGSLSALKGEVVIESVELAYESFTVKRPQLKKENEG